MRRSILLLSLLLAAAVPALVLAGPAGAEHLASQIVCPQISTCCPTPTDGQPANSHAAQVCCQQTTACCPSAGTCCPSTCCATTCPSGSLTISASPNPSTAPGKVTVSGVLSTSPAAGVTVALWREQAGQSSFRQMAQTTTDSSGRYAFTLKRGTVMADQAWYVTAGSLRSATIDQQVRALVALVSSSHTVVSGQSIALHGKVSPSHAGGVVLIEQRRGRSWHVIARPRLSKSSSYTVSHRFTQTGPTKLRAVLAGNARNLTSTSPTVSLTVDS